MEQESKSNSDMLRRPWDALPPELLALIFSYCPLQAKLLILSVCRSWNRVMDSPCLWQDIEDTLEWSKKRGPDETTLSHMLRRLFHLCSHSPKTLLVYGVGPLTFPLITSCAENLTTLKIPWSVITNEMVFQEARKLSNLRFLDLSYCHQIEAPAIEAIGRHCRLLTGFRRFVKSDVIGDYHDAEALAIAATMHELKSLELHFLKFVSRESVLRVLSNCTKLDYLDLRLSCFLHSKTKSLVSFDSMSLYILSGRSSKDICIQCYARKCSKASIVLKRIYRKEPLRCVYLPSCGREKLYRV
ncbi:F-box domain containing protein [Trema orientale]|uniref:F-box domain containing protein n=1 Tax=Trema orientale TaxID=63057 RepID=A0A2P5CGP3_TREOI|nr:F-box domain containing protein [Trema orientale]